MSGSDSGYNIWGVISGVAGVLGFLPIAWIYARFPSRKIRAVDNFMRDTKVLFNRSIKQGLLTDEADLRLFCGNICSLDWRIEDMQRQVKELPTWHARVRGCWNGVTNKILALHAEIEKLHHSIDESSSRNRRRLDSEGYAQGLARLLCAQSQERQSYILSLANAIPNSPSSSSEHCTDVAPSDDGEQDPQMAHPQPSHPQTPPNGAPQVSPAWEASLDKHRSYREIRRDILCQSARQLYDAPAISLPPHDSSPLRLRAQDLSRFQELALEMSGLLARLAAGGDVDDTEV